MKAREPIVLPEKMYVWLQRIVMTIIGSLVVLCVNHHLPKRDEIFQTWVSYPNEDHNGAEIFGKFFRMSKHKTKVSESHPTLQAP